MRIETPVNVAVHYNIKPNYVLEFCELDTRYYSPYNHYKNMEQPMSHSNISQNIVKKIETLSPQRIAEVEDFIDFLYQRDYDRNLTKSTQKLSEKKLKEIWDNPEDDDYNKL
jgi:hypothetical protein